MRFFIALITVMHSCRGVIELCLSSLINAGVFVDLVNASLWRICWEQTYE